MLQTHAPFLFINFSMSTQPSHRVYLALGANLGDRHQILDQAIGLIEQHIGHVCSRSSYIETEPWGFNSDNKFLNACIAVDTLRSPQELLEATQSIERQLGRTSKSMSGQYHDRPIDIDILLYDRLSIQIPGLTVPHPLMFERDFVMRPLSEILDITTLHR